MAAGQGKFCVERRGSCPFRQGAACPCSSASPRTALFSVEFSAENGFVEVKCTFGISGEIKVGAGFCHWESPFDLSFQPFDYSTFQQYRKARLELQQINLLLQTFVSP